MEGILHSLGIVGAKLFTNILAFAIFFGILYKFAWKNVGGMLEERRTRIREELDRIERAKQEVEKLREEYRTKIGQIEAVAKDRMDKIEAEARAKAEAILFEAHDKAHRTTETARRTIQQEADNARRQLVSEITSLARAAAEKVLEHEIDEADNRRLVETFLSDLEKSKSPA